MDRSLRWLVPICLVAAGLYLFWGLRAANWAFVLELRATRLAALTVVGASVGVATVLFQTVSTNRILTPSIMGFDALYVLMQTALVAVLGISGFAALPGGTKFLLETGGLVAAALLLFGTLLARGAQDLPRMILTGVIFGILFRSAAGFVGRLLDPNAYAVVQQASFATFSRVEASLLPWAGLLALSAMGTALALAPRLDVLALGRRTSVPLGLGHDRLALLTLGLVAVLVASATALVGPIGFFGLIVASLAHALTERARHAALLPAAALSAVALLVGGQFLFERLLRLEGTLSVVVELAGGLFFLWLLMKGRIR
ncbi:enterobactin ABC transporter permease [Cereibacter sphaeroides]|uniref:iron chelate uptake ABC transporter family permease subunit n=1 Tax=Cereibacter sphaeroides TaxID=1063 RepID=UPI000F51F7B3|nr:iron chelate uptake ABC transporter family permease subunit [Cereibacter sphaeroides]AZB65910.1 enterobactin ABC transporter permease [Cereibacter sphaeroides]AZB70669.1 enterobactin ABC transporter permease [Cereibacter sphaeroides]